MAPELFQQTLHKIGSKVDIFALGAILFNMRALDRPFGKWDDIDGKFL